MIKIIIFLLIIVGVSYRISLYLDSKLRMYSFLQKQQKYIKIIYFTLSIAILFCFTVFNYIKSGSLFQELFYKIEKDFGLDFYVFLSDSVLYKECYINNIQGFNPPLIKIISLFIYRSFPKEYQTLYANGVINAEIPDIRLIIQAVFPFLLMVTGALVFLSILIYINKKGNCIEKICYTLITLFNMGIVYAIERGNYILVAVPLSLCFVLNYKNNNKYIREASFICLALAAGIKVYPCVFGLLLIKEKMWKESIRTIFYGILALFGPFVFYGGFQGIIGFFLSLIQNDSSGGERIGTLNISSIFNTILSITGFSKNQIELYSPKLKLFSFVLLIIAIICFVIIKEKWKQVTLLTVIIILYSGTAHTYMLAFLIIPIFLFINENSSKSIMNYIYLLLFILLSSIIVLPPSENIILLREAGIRLTSLMVLQQSSLIFLFLFLIIESMHLFIGTYIKKYRNSNKN